MLARGPIVRDITVNLVALRRLRTQGNQLALQRYILGLALLAATEPLDGFLRVGCILVQDPEQKATWEEVLRTGERNAVDLSNGDARAFIKVAASEYGVGEDRLGVFDHARAKEDVAKGKKKPGK